MFMHRNMSLVLFDFQKNNIASTLDIENNDIFLNLTKMGPELMNEEVP